MSLVQSIKITQQRAGISDDAHRANIRDIKPTASSCTQLSYIQQRTLLSRYNKMIAGKTVKAKSQLPPLRKRIYALWGALAKCQKVTNDSKRACDTWFNRTFNQRVDTATSQQWYDAVEALQKWLAR